SGSHIVAIAYDDAGRELAEVHVSGVNGYTFTGRILAWGAQRAAEGGLQGTGALGPVDGFGLDALADGCRWAGLAEEGRSVQAAGHQVGRAHPVAALVAAPEPVHPRVLQKAPDDGDDTDVLRHARHAGP